jgi:hypothetical protein
LTASILGPINSPIFFPINLANTNPADAILAPTTPTLVIGPIGFSSSSSISAPLKKSPIEQALLDSRFDTPVVNADATVVTLLTTYLLRI